MISKEYLDPIQVKMIHNHIIMAQELINDAHQKHQKAPDFGYVEDTEQWNISESKNIISGYTSMDNFQMGAFFDAIGVLPGTVHWGEGYHDVETKYGIKDYFDEETRDETWKKFLARMEEKKNENTD